ncbi:hypothetical protein OAG24_00470 [bacterium]|nr:hypothetical protein [bacterium]
MSNSDGILSTGLLKQLIKYGNVKFLLDNCEQIRPLDLLKTFIRNFDKILASEDDLICFSTIIVHLTTKVGYTYDSILKIKEIREMRENKDKFTELFMTFDSLHLWNKCNCGESKCKETALSIVENLLTMKIHEYIEGAIDRKNMFEKILSIVMASNAVSLDFSQFDSNIRRICAKSGALIRDEELSKIIIEYDLFNLYRLNKSELRSEFDLIFERCKFLSEEAPDYWKIVRFYFIKIIKGIADETNLEKIEKFKDILPEFAPESIVNIIKRQPEILQRYYLGLGLISPKGQNIENRLELLGKVGIKNYCDLHERTTGYRLRRAGGQLKHTINTENSLLEEIKSYPILDIFFIIIPGISAHYFTRDEFDILLEKQEDFYNRQKINKNDLRCIERNLENVETYNFPPPRPLREQLNKLKIIKEILPADKGEKKFNKLISQDSQIDLEEIFPRELLGTINSFISQISQDGGDLGPIVFRRLRGEGLE